MKRKEREEIMQELYEEEQKQAMEQQHRANVEKALRQRIEVRESLMHQMTERQEKLRQEAAEDAKYKEEVKVVGAFDQKVIVLVFSCWLKWPRISGWNSCPIRRGG
jgi:isocitrate lyase